MKKGLKILLRTLLLSCFIPLSVNSQILEDTASLNIVKRSTGYIYNLRFDEYRKTFGKLRDEYPEHPVVYLMEGLRIYWENYPLTSSSPASAVFEKQLRRCIEVCEESKDKSAEIEFLLANLSARGFLLLFYLNNDLTMSVIPLASSTYKYLRRSYNYTDVYPDFLFFTGLYDYTREAYPETYPVYKPLAMLFPKGDRSKGLMDLQEAAKNSIFLKAEASIFLSSLYLSFENNYEQAYLYTKSLHELYPRNAEYLGYHVRNLLLTKRYAGAEELIESSDKMNSNAFYQTQLFIFKGILQEKKYNNDKLAEEFYIKGIRGISAFGHYGNEYAAYGYFGLSRISARKADYNLKKTYRKKAEELADFRNVNFD